MILITTISFEILSSFDGDFVLRNIFDIINNLMNLTKNISIFVISIVAADSRTSSRMTNMFTLYFHTSLNDRKCNSVHSIRLETMSSEIVRFLPWGFVLMKITEKQWIHSWYEMLFNIRLNVATYFEKLILHQERANLKKNKNLNILLIIWQKLSTNCISSQALIS